MIESIRIKPVPWKAAWPILGALWFTIVTGSRQFVRLGIESGLRGIDLLAQEK
jgi:hypothetical protein